MIGKDAKDILVEEALNYIATYTTRNDVSSRNLQRDLAYAGVVPVLTVAVVRSRSRCP